MNQQSVIQSSVTGIGDVATGSTVIRAVAKAVTNVVAKLHMMEQVRREREELNSLSSRMLRDIGVDKQSARHEIERSYFDVPTSRW